MVDLQVRPIVEALLDAARDEIGSLLRVPRSDSRAAAAPTEHCPRPVTRRPPQTADRRACRRLTITTVRFSPAHNLAADERLPGERPEPIPHRRLQRVCQLVARGPPLDVDQPLAPTRDSVIVAVLPPRPERPENGLTAIVAPRCSSSSQSHHPRSDRPRRPGRHRRSRRSGSRRCRARRVRAAGAPSPSAQGGHRRAARRCRHRR